MSISKLSIVEREIGRDLKRVCVRLLGQEKEKWQGWAAKQGGPRQSTCILFTPMMAITTSESGHHVSGGLRCCQSLGITGSFTLQACRSFVRCGLTCSVLSTGASPQAL